MNEIVNYNSFITDIKNRIKIAQVNAILSANSELIEMYWDIGNLINLRQKEKGWGANVINKISTDLKKDLPESKGFSERNLKYMLRFSIEYPYFKLNKESSKTINLIDNEKVQQPVAQFNYNLLKQIPWGHNILLFEKIPNIDERFWYIQQVLENGWSREVLKSMIKSNLIERKGSKTNNFQYHLSNSQTDLVKQTLKDPYVFDFLSLTEPFTERELEFQLVNHIENFLIELGKGFAFVGKQYHIEVENQDFYIDLLFYHLKLRCYIVIDLKKGDFKPEYVGKMNFYCSLIDELLKNDNDQPTIGLILCENKNKIIAEYSLRDNLKPIGISEYELSKVIPNNFKTSLPTIEEIENELNNKIKENRD